MLHILLIILGILCIPKIFEVMPKLDYFGMFAVFVFGIILFTLVL